MLECTQLSPDKINFKPLLPLNEMPSKKTHKLIFQFSATKAIIPLFLSYTGLLFINGVARISYTKRKKIEQIIYQNHCFQM